MSIRSSRKDFLIDAAKLDDKEVLFIYPREDLDQATALAALDAQYGKGHFDTWQHGTALRIARRAFSHHGETWKRFNDANEHFWAARKENLPKEEIDRRRELVKEPKQIWNKICKIDDVSFNTL